MVMAQALPTAAPSASDATLMTIRYLDALLPGFRFEIDSIYLIG